MGVFRYRTIPAGGITGIGLLFAGLVLWDVRVSHVGDLMAIGSELLLLVFSCWIVVAGVALLRSGISAPDLWRAFAWMVTGSLVVGILGASLFVHLDVIGAVQADLFFFGVAAVNSGASVGLLVGWYDVRSRRRARQVTESERRFRAVFEGTLDALVLADDGGRYVEANPAAADLFGVPRVDLLGKQISDFAGPEVDFEDSWGKFRSSESQRGIFQIQRPGGETRTVEFAATRDVLSGVHLSALRDVTERERSQQQVAAQREQLSFLNRMLRHHVRNNLQVVVAQAERLEASDDPSAVAILDRIDAIEAFLDRVRRFTTSLAHDQPLHTLSLSPTIDAAIASATGDTPAVEIVVDVPDVGVVADDLLVDVFENVLSNAVQHNDSDLPRVHISALVEAETVTVTIADNGRGITDTQKEQIFEWANGPAADVGFGLYLSQALVTRYGGRIRVTDAADLGGTAFSIQLRRGLHDAIESGSESARSAL